MSLRVTAETVAEFKETRKLLEERIDRLSELTKRNPVSCTFAGYRFVFERREDILLLISLIDQAISEYENCVAATDVAAS